MGLRALAAMSIAVWAVLGAGRVLARQGAPLSGVTLERVMSDPDWIARSPERVYWTDDGTGLLYMRKRLGSEVRDMWRVDVRLEGGRYVAREPRVLSAAEQAVADSRGGDVSDDRSRKVFTRNGDVVIKDLETGEERALTRTSAGEFGARFMAGERRVMFQREGAVLARDLETGLEEQLVDLRFSEPPKPPEERREHADYLRGQQERLFETVRQGRARREASRAEEEAERKAREPLGPPVVYMGEELELRSAEVSPTGEWAVVRASKKGSREGKRDTMPVWVTDDGYVRATPARTKVGTVERRGEELFLIDLRPGVSERKWKLDFGVLPGITEDPLAAIKAAAAARRESAKGDTGPTVDEAEPDAGRRKKQEEAAKPRAVSVREVAWSDDGARVVVQAFSLDNKDRWLAAVDLEGHALRALDRISDEAWVNGRFAQMGWLEDDRTVWYLSEATGYSHLYTVDVEAAAGGDGSEGLRRRLTGWEEHAAGEKYEVADVSPSRDGAFLYFTANMDRPGVHELYRVPVSGERAVSERLTFLGGQNDFVLSPDERGVAVLHSDTVTPPELYVQALGAGSVGAAAHRVTRTVEDAYTGVEWIRPEVVGVPGRDGRTIWARVYEKRGNAGEGGVNGAGKPCVVFVHGAGYLQDAHEGWSHYFREHLFHNLLCERGYVVIAPDFRASAGYGSAWRTAIYRRMGEPELEDVEDCVSWLAVERGVDRARVGMYGGSYGGFLTLMAMFTKPGQYACGAALRPVTDWAHYNDGYTANILNTPEADPEAYERSSPIERAAGLEGALLICHGMLDDNVLFQDTVRLAQRLIELKKENWEVAAYPVEAHAFREATSWLDEYRRIDRLFREHLEGRRATTGRAGGG